IWRLRAALAIADELELSDIRAGALITLGESRATLDETGAEEDRRRGLELAARLNSPIAVSGYLGLADELIDRGDIDGGFEARAEVKHLTERLGVAMGADWLRGERPGELYMLGRWDEALRLAEDFVSWSCGGHRHYLEGPCRQVRGGICLARGELER